MYFGYRCLAEQTLTAIEIEEVAAHGLVIDATSPLTLFLR